MSRAGNGAGYLSEERMKMRSKLLMMSTAALLAGTLAAAGQSIQPGGGAAGTPQEKEKGAQSNQIPKGGQVQRNESRPGQAQREQDKSKVESQGQAQRDQDKSKTQGQTERELDRSKSQTQGQVQRDQDKSKIQTQGQTERDQDKSKSQTQGQTERDQDKSKSQTQGQTERNQNQGQNQRDQDRTQQGAREGERGGNVSVTFSTEQRTRIRETVLKERNAPRVGKVDFSIREGTVIPRTVRVVEIPDVIVEIHPEWRGFKYFLVNEELVVVDPDTLRIVAVIDV
jgi:uncharacterized protein DUF1236